MKNGKGRDALLYMDKGRSSNGNSAQEAGQTTPKFWIRRSDGADGRKIDVGTWHVIPAHAATMKVEAGKLKVASEAPTLEHSAEGLQGVARVADVLGRILGLLGSMVALVQVGNLAATLHLHMESTLKLTPAQSGGKVINMAIGGVGIYAFAFMARFVMTKLNWSTYIQNAAQLTCAMLAWHVASNADKTLMMYELPRGSTEPREEDLKALSSFTYHMAGFLLASPSLKTVVISDVADLHTFTRLFALQGFFEELGKFSQTLIQPWVMHTFNQCSDGSCTKESNIVGKAATLVAFYDEGILFGIIILTICTQLVKWKVAGVATEKIEESHTMEKIANAWWVKHALTKEVCRICGKEEHFLYSCIQKGCDLAPRCFDCAKVAEVEEECKSPEAKPQSMVQEGQAEVRALRT